MMVLVGVAVLTFASLVFFVERDSQFVDGKWTFLDSVWWGILTVTTVGHHVKSPQTFTGKLLGGFCALAGTFILTLPIPIVVNSFANYYKNRLWRNEVAQKKRERAAAQSSKAREMQKLYLVQAMAGPMAREGLNLHGKA